MGVVWLAQQPPPANPGLPLGALAGAVALVVIITLVQIVLTVRRGPGDGPHDDEDGPQ